MSSSENSEFLSLPTAPSRPALELPPPDDGPEDDVVDDDPKVVLKKLVIIDHSMENGDKINQIKDIRPPS